MYEYLQSKIKEYKTVFDFLSRFETEFTVTKIHPYDLAVLTTDGVAHDFIHLSGSLFLLDGRAYYQTVLTEAKNKDIQ